MVVAEEDLVAMVILDEDGETSFYFLFFLNDFVVFVICL